MKTLIVVVAMVLMAGVVWGEMPSVVNTSMDASYFVYGGSGSSTATTDLEYSPKWPGVVITPPDEDEGQVLIASTKQFDSNPKRRIIKVYVVDPNPNVPMDECILYESKEYLTDLTDQEIFFGLKFLYPPRTVFDIPGSAQSMNIDEFLKKYNKERIKYLDKKLSRETGRDVYLEPVKIRELKMVIVNITTF